MISWKLQIFLLCLTFGGIFFVFKRIKKERNDHQKLDIRKKSTIFKISFQNFLCKLSTPKNSNTPVLQYSQILDVPFDNTVLKLMTQRRGGGVAQLPSTQVGGYSLQALSWFKFFSWLSSQHHQRLRQLIAIERASLSSEGALLPSPFIM